MEVFHPVRNLCRAFFFDKGIKRKEVPMDFIHEIEHNFIINRSGQIFNKQSSQFVGKNTEKERVVFLTTKHHISLRRHRVLLATFDENVPEEMKEIANRCHVDHMDGKHSNNSIENLRYLLPGEHATKTIQTTLNRKSNATSLSKAVQIVCNLKAQEPKTPVGTVFISTQMAMHEMCLPKGNGSVSNSARNGHRTGGYRFEFVEQMQQPLLFTEFISIPHLPVECRWRGHLDGRLISPNGVITRGSRVPDTKYTRVSVNRKTHLTHRLLASIKLGRALRDDEIVLHDETGAAGTVLPDGSYSNRACDLRVGSHTDNMRDMQANKKRKREEKQELEK